jgi:hypothetical protein
LNILFLPINAWIDYCLHRIGLQQGFATGEMGFKVRFAQQQSRDAHVCFGSRVDGALARTF